MSHFLIAIDPYLRNLVMIFFSLQCQFAITGLTPGDFIHIIGDAHVYKTHIRPLQEQLQKLPKPFPVSRTTYRKLLVAYDECLWC
jgi:thymidylate synthase